MKTELIFIGNELLSGRTLNTNANFLSKELELHGFDLICHTTVADEYGSIELAFKEALIRSDIVISTGGLGPTLDDITRQAAANLFHSSFEYSTLVAEDLEKRFGPNLSTLKDQATIPKKAIPLTNLIGTAPALIFHEGEKVLILLPGPPFEMQPLFCQKVLPFLQKKFPPTILRFSKTLHFFNLFEKKVDPVLRTLKQQFPLISFGIYPSIGTLSCTLSIHAKNQQEADLFLKIPFDILKNEFFEYHYESASGTLNEAVHKLFTNCGWTLSLAESCTGGSAASSLTSLAGSSKYFLGSFVTYANSLKTAILGVPSSLIETEGAVSQKVAEAMVLGALEKSGSTHSAAVTGIAGPTGGSEGKPIGTVWCAVCRKDESPISWKLEGKATREMIITASVNALFAGLIKHYGRSVHPCGLRGGEKA